MSLRGIVVHPPFEIRTSGVKLQCRLTPRGAADAVTGLVCVEDRSALKCTVRAVPEKGKANTALEKLIASWLDVPKSSVAVVAGSRSRNKTLEIEGDPDAVVHAVKFRIAELEHDE